VADWHALTTDWASPEALDANTIEMVLDWLAVDRSRRRRFSPP
jgi:tryptophanyl-tRNA synthetase